MCSSFDIFLYVLNQKKYKKKGREKFVEISKPLNPMEASASQRDGMFCWMGSFETQKKGQKEKEDSTTQQIRSTMPLVSWVVDELSIRHPHIKFRVGLVEPDKEQISSLITTPESIAQIASSFAFDESSF